MSQFKTFLPVNLEEIFQSLPKKGLTVHSIRMEKDDKGNYVVVIVWETPKYDTGRSVPIEFPLEALQRRRLPKGVRDTARKEKELPKPIVGDTKPVERFPPQNLIRTSEEYDKCVAGGIPLEFQGVEPVWRPATKDHTFTEGFYYRKVSAPPIELVPMEPEKIPQDAA